MRDTILSGGWTCGILHLCGINVIICLNQIAITVSYTPLNKECYCLVIAHWIFMSLITFKYVYQLLMKLSRFSTTNYNFIE